MTNDDHSPRRPKTLGKMGLGAENPGKSRKIPERIKKFRPSGGKRQTTRTPAANSTSFNQL
jgi:hypothetical protein